ncbi:MAG: hypothetical protein WDN48_10615 [Pseudolabrys sp.]
MTPGLVFAFGAMLAFGIGDIVYKRAAAAGVEASQFVMVQAWVFCPSVTLYAWLTGNLDPHYSALWGALAVSSCWSPSPISPAACRKARSAPMRRSSASTSPSRRRSPSYCWASR